MKKHNERGAGRKPLPYKTKQMRVPEPLIERLSEIINEWKAEQSK